MHTERTASSPESTADLEIAARLIERLRDGQLTNDEFEDEFLRLPQRGTIGDAFSDAWGCYSDLRTYRLVGKDKPVLETAAMLTRWALLLRSGRAYDWPPQPGPLESMPRILVSSMIAGAIAATVLIGAFRFLRLNGPSALVSFGIGTAVSLIVGVRQWRDNLKAPRVREQWLRGGDFLVYPFRSMSAFEAAGGNPADVIGRGLCPGCGYDLAGQTGPGCPECGLGRHTG